ncbi:MAG: MT-A70 family methyltransferase [Bradymonadia bacterium]
MNAQLALLDVDPCPRFSVIYADPPWAYRDTCDAGKRGAQHKYPTQSIDWIKGLDVAGVAEDDAILFLWATWPLLTEALSVFSAWGFTYKTCGFVWVKTNPKAGTPVTGMGHYTRANAEILLLGTRGSPKVESRSVSQIVEAAGAEAEAIYAPRGAHSAKPDVFRQRIVELCGDVARLEMFARERAPGWQIWGNQAPDGSDVDLRERVPSAGSSILKIG